NAALDLECLAFKFLSFSGATDHFKGDGQISDGYQRIWVYWPEDTTPDFQRLSLQRLRISVAALVEEAPGEVGHRCCFVGIVVAKDAAPNSQRLPLQLLSFCEPVLLVKRPFQPVHCQKCLRMVRPKHSAPNTGSMPGQRF